MRRLLMFLLLVVALTVVSAQETAPALSLSLSQSVLAIKVTDPMRQLTAFKPLLNRIDELFTFASPAADQLPSTKLTTLLGDVVKIPGVNAMGNFWIVMLPQAVAQATDAGTAPKPAPFALLVPLTDAGQFRAFLATPSVQKTFPPSQVFEQYALVKPGVDLPQYTGVNIDLSLVSKRDVVLVTQPAALDLKKLIPMPSGQTLPFSLAPIMRVLEDIKANQQRAECGLAMVGEDLSAETITTPVPGSPLQKSLTAVRPSTLPLDLAAYLPENLAYCGASEPALEGMPGMGSLIPMVFGIAASFLDGEHQRGLLMRMNALTKQCSQGRAIGLTVPASALTPGQSTLVAVYHIDNTNEATANVMNFVNEFIRGRDSLFGGALTNVIKVFHKPAYEKIAGVPVDLLKIVIPMPGQPKAGAAQAITIEAHIGYFADKMVFTAGEGSREQMVGIISRIQTGKPGFTSGKRFAALRTGLPMDVRGFETLDLPDLCRAGINLVPIAREDKITGLRMLGIFPAPTGVISTYQTVSDGRLLGEVRVPAGQLDFVSSMIKALLARRNATKTP